MTLNSCSKMVSIYTLIPTFSTRVPNFVLPPPSLESSQREKKHVKRLPFRNTYLTAGAYPIAVQQHRTTAAQAVKYEV